MMPDDNDIQNEDSSHASEASDAQHLDDQASSHEGQAEIKVDDLDTNHRPARQTEQPSPKDKTSGSQMAQREFSEKPDAKVSQQDRRAALLRDKAKKIEQERMKAALAADTFSAIEEESVVTSAEERGAKLRQARLERKKALIKLALSTVGAIIFIYLAYVLFKPFTLDVDSGRKYTICKTFIELQVKYPTTLKYSRVEFRTGNSVEVLYSHVDPFGQYRMDTMRCYFRDIKEAEVEKYGPVGPYVLGNIEYNKRSVDKAKIDAMNISVYPILLGEIDYDYPTGFPDALRELYFDSDSFFRIQL